MKKQLTKSEKIANRIGIVVVAAFAGFAVWYIAKAISMALPHIALNSY